MKIGYLGKHDAYSLEMLRRLRSGNEQHQILSWEYGQPAPSMDLEVLIASGTVGERELLGQARLGLLQTATAGYDGVDVEAATEAGIWVASAPTGRTGNGESVAEFAVLLMLAASRRLNEELAWRREGDRTRPEINRSLYGKTVCIVGLGGIGHLLVERLRGFGMVLTGVDHSAEHVPAGVKAYGRGELKQALASADYVVLAVPGSRENENMIDAAAIAAMKPGAVVVNVGRGTLIDEAPLLAAVESGYLFAAGLDVVKDEPLTAENPLLSEPRIFLTPHIAGMTDLMLDGTVRYLGETLRHYAEGCLPEGVVNAPKDPRVPLHGGIQSRAA